MSTTERTLKTIQVATDGKLIGTEVKFVFLHLFLRNMLKSKDYPFSLNEF